VSTNLVGVFGVGTSVRSHAEATEKGNNNEDGSSDPEVLSFL
jgi:hypothetical protein